MAEIVFRLDDIFHLSSFVLYVLYILILFLNIRNANWGRLLCFTLGGDKQTFRKCFSRKNRWTNVLARVTRLGEFLLIGRLLSLCCLIKNKISPIV
jgi:hypothetical protein